MQRWDRALRCRNRYHSSPVRQSCATLTVQVVPPLRMVVCHSSHMLTWRRHHVRRPAVAAIRLRRELAPAAQIVGLEQTSALPLLRHQSVLWTSSNNSSSRNWNWSSVTVVVAVGIPLCLPGLLVLETAVGQVVEQFTGEVHEMIEAMWSEATRVLGRLLPHRRRQNLVLRQAPGMWLIILLILFIKK